MKIIIIGGGFLGQLLHVFFPRARVFDWRPSAPSGLASRELGPQYLWEEIPELPCKWFDVHTTVDGCDATPDSILAYKRKVGKEHDDGDWCAQFAPHMIGWNCTMPEPRVEYNKRILQVRADRRTLSMADGSVESFDLLLSTIPLPSMLSMCGWTEHLREFKSCPIHLKYRATTFQVHDSSMHVDYRSRLDSPVYRETLRNGRLFLESLQPFGYTPNASTTKILPGKIYANPFARRFTQQLSYNGIHCYGRFSTWTPDELAHETLRAVRTFKQAQGL